MLSHFWINDPIAYELPLTEGIQYERRLFNLLFGSVCIQ